MKISIESLVEKLDKHIDAKILPGLAEPTRFVIGFSRAILLNTIRAKLNEIPKDGVLRDENGNIETDALRAALHGGFDAAGSVRILGIRFEKADADAFLDTL